jgi:hypothetical protein
VANDHTEESEPIAVKEPAIEEAVAPPMVRIRVLMTSPEPILTASWLIESGVAEAAAL